MIKPIGIWGLFMATTAPSAPSTAVFMTPMRGIYQPLFWLLTVLGGR